MAFFVGEMLGSVEIAGSMHLTCWVLCKDSVFVCELIHLFHISVLICVCVCMLTCLLQNKFRSYDDDDEEDVAMLPQRM